nr:PREDICTED: tektin-2 [Bemisia tabaci]
MSVVLEDKYLPRVSCADWEKKVHHLQEVSSSQRAGSTALRFESNQLRNETEIEVLWNKYNSNRKLADRIKEIEKWRYILEQQLQNVKGELAAVNNEKSLTDNQIQSLNILFSLVNECLTIRNERNCADLCEDIGQTELRKEHSLLERMKKTLTDQSLAGWEQIKRLDELKAKLEYDLADKHKTLDIESTCLQLEPTSSDISYKADALRNLKLFISHEAWLARCESLKNSADCEVRNSQKLCEEMCVPRQKFHNELFIQTEATNFALRKRVYETRRLRNELDWQNQKVKQEMERLMKEINEIDQALQAKTNVLKLAETRIEKRMFRPGTELCNDDTLSGLKQEIIYLRETRKNLSHQLDTAKACYNELEDQMLTLELELADKNHALQTDIKCMDLRLSILSSAKKN